jgi:hypothetical protein
LILGYALNPLPIINSGISGYFAYSGSGISKVAPMISRLTICERAGLVKDDSTGVSSINF